MTVPTSQVHRVPLDTEAVRQGAEKHGVVQIDEGGLTAAEFARFMETLGEPMFTEGETPVEQFPMLNVVTNIGRMTRPKSVFHSDTTYVSRPPSYSGLYAVDVPAQGGATIFIDQYVAYEALPADMKELLTGATVLHSASGVQLADGSENCARHPVICRHAGTNRPVLYLTTPARMSQLRLADGTERSDLIEQLYEHSLSCGSRSSHAWSKGDMVVWDNRCTLHAADHSNVIGHRTLYRALVRGGVPA